MCDPVTIGLIVGGVGAATGVYSAVQKPPKPPAPPQEAKAPVADAFRNRNAASSPRGGPGGQASSYLLSGLAGNTARSTLLGQ